MQASANPVVGIIGAGPAGLATAACLKARGIAYRLLEAEPEVGSSWRRHYQRLHLHTVKEHSVLPGLSFPAQVERYPARELVVAYLEAYVRHHGLKVDCGVSLIRATQVDGGWSLTTSAGELRTRALVRKGRIAVYSNPESFFPGGVRFSDRRAREFDAVVLATGYRPALLELLGPHPAITALGYPHGIDGGDGLYFVGFRNVATGLLRQAGIDAQRVAELVARLPDVFAAPASKRSVTIADA